MSARKTVAIVGGGVSGLAAAKAFAERGHRVIGFERGDDFGGVWEPSRSYPGVETQSPKDLYRYTDHPMPAEYPEWPTGAQVHAYLHAYADKHELAPLFRLNASVSGLRRRADGKPGWTLTVEHDGRERDEDVDFVAVCTGQFSDRNIVSHPGQDAFVAVGGRTMHSSEYTDAAIAEGRRVVVLGGSKSATDIAVNATEHGAASVALVYPRNVWRVPRFVGGINFKHLLYMRAQEQQFNGWEPTALGRAAAAVARPLVWANFRALETLLKLQLGLKRHGMVPDVPIERAVSCSIPIVTPGFFEALGDGRLRAVLGTIERYEEDGRVRLSTGEIVDADIVISAVGWRQGVPYLPDEYRKRLIEKDGLYRLYRFAVNPALPQMGFVGFNSSFCSVLSAELIANWLVRFADGRLARQPDADEMNAGIDRMLRWRREERPAAQVYGGLCTAPFHFRHFDELLADMGANLRRRGALAERFRPPDAEAYGRFLASVPAYRAA